MIKRKLFFFGFFTLFSGFSLLAVRAEAVTPYDMGAPRFIEIYISPTGNDANSGADITHPLRTFAPAWRQIPADLTGRTAGYRINLLPGEIPCGPGDPDPNGCLTYFSDKKGTFTAPIVIRSVDSNGNYSKGSSLLRGGAEFVNNSYLYILGVKFRAAAGYPFNNSGNNVLHIAGGDHVLLRGVATTGTRNNFQIQESLKVNQTEYIYVEDSEISGSYGAAFDYMAVHYGHVISSRVFNADQWCMYLKGGTSDIVIDGNLMGNPSDTLSCESGFSAGEGNGFEFMVTPWLHYQTYNIRFANNIVQNTNQAVLSVQGGYNILLANNTFYKVGRQSHAIQFIFGSRSCDGDMATCRANNLAGGWGLSSGGGDWIPSKNVYVYNNVLYNPDGYRSQWNQIVVLGPTTPPAGSNVPSPARTDDNLQIRGNIIWNGPGSGIGLLSDFGSGGNIGCRNTNSTCNEAQILLENAVNTVRPELLSPATGDFRPVEGGNLYQATTYAIPSFPGGDQPSQPLVPEGDLINTVLLDRNGTSRTTDDIPGAYASSSNSGGSGGSGGTGGVSGSNGGSGGAGSGSGGTGGSIVPVDADGDGIPDSSDNCPSVANLDQRNLDGDSQGDACDSDDDNDGIVDSLDNCPLLSNANQLNTDGDPQGNVCDSDDDNDGIVDTLDNCPLASNPAQTDTDRDGIGDVCDSSPGIMTYGGSGRITLANGSPLSGVSIRFSRVSGTGTVPGSVTTDASGNWSRSGFRTGTTYRVRPVRTGYSFNPTSINFSSVRTNLNFTATSTTTTTPAGIVPTINSAMKTRLRNIYLSGLSLGNRANVFAKVGDALTDSPGFLANIGCGWMDLAGFSGLAPIIDYFDNTLLSSGDAHFDCPRNSFNHRSIAAFEDWSAEDVLVSFSSPVSDCPAPFNNPLLCELHRARPAVALIMLGTMDAGSYTWDAAAFRNNLTNVVNRTVSAGVIPVLSTIPPRLDSVATATGTISANTRVTAINQIIVDIARTQQIPLWNYWQAMQSLGTTYHYGLEPDGVFPNTYNGGDGATFTSAGLHYGYNQRNLTALQVLEKVKRVVIDNGTPD